MQNRNRWTMVIVMITGLLLTACGQAATDASSNTEVKPAQVEHLEGVNPSRIVLTEEAAQRIDIQTAQAREVQVDGARRTVIPYAALLYDPEGNTWVYTSSESLAFVRQPISVDRVDGDMVVLSDGLTAGIAVVTVGATELYGAESEFEEE